MGVNGRQGDTRYIIFQQKREKQGKNWKKQGKNTKKQEETGKNREKKKQKITKNTKTRF